MPCVPSRSVSCSSARTTAIRHRADGHRGAGDHADLPPVRLLQRWVNRGFGLSGLERTRTAEQTQSRRSGDRRRPSWRRPRAGVRRPRRRAPSTPPASAVELVHCPGHPRTMKALLDGRGRLRQFRSGPELLLANQRHGGDGVVIASAISRSAQHVSARPGLDTREDLRGKRWGVRARSDMDECAIVIAFDRWGWKIARTRSTSSSARPVPVSTPARQNASMSPSCMPPSPSRPPSAAGG